MNCDIASPISISSYSRSLGQRSKTHPLIISLLSLNDLGKDADANKIDLTLPLLVTKGFS
jgi:hypothetical protein